jgi:transposase-like protein
MNITDPRFTDPEKAREWLEAQRWPDGPYCPHCGNADPEKIKKLQGKSHRPGLYQCAECREQFTVTVGSVMERSKIPLHKWVMAMHLLGSSKKGMSAHQLHRMLGVTYQTAWFLAHRIREAMMDKAPAGPLGGEGTIVEADETYLGPKDRVTKRTIRGKPSQSQKRVVVGLVERGRHTRLFHVERGDAATVRDVLVRNVSRRSVLHTDEAGLYVETGKEFDRHQSVKHTGGEYVRYEDGAVIHTNTIENVFSVLKRGMRGVYQHCGEAHLHRYLAEFEFRYNHRSGLGIEDAERVGVLAKRTEGKRLTYRRPHKAPHA